jgi:hypothetical protein
MYIKLLVEEGILNHKCLPFLSHSFVFLVVSWRSQPRLCGPAATSRPTTPVRTVRRGPFLGLASTIHQAGRGEDGVDEHRRAVRDIARAELA